MFLTHDQPSLLDCGYTCQIDVWAVFVELDEDHLPVSRSSLWRWMKPGFRHVEIWKPLPTGDGWLRIDTSVEAATPQFFHGPPWVELKRLNPTSLRVRRTVPNTKWRDRFFAGPITCVELSKAFLGVSSFFVRTPYQLYNYLRKVH